MQACSMSLEICCAITADLLTRHILNFSNFFPFIFRFDTFLQCSALRIRSSSMMRFLTLPNTTFLILILPSL